MSGEVVLKWKEGERPGDFLHMPVATVLPMIEMSPALDVSVDLPRAMD